MAEARGHRAAILDGREQLCTMPMIACRCARRYYVSVGYTVRSSFWCGVERSWAEHAGRSIYGKLAEYHDVSTVTFVGVAGEGSGGHRAGSGRPRCLAGVVERRIAAAHGWADGAGRGGRFG